MTLVDRYMLALFMKILGVSFMSLTGLYLVVVAFSNLEDLLHLAAQQGLLNTLAQFYGVQVLTFFDQTSGLLALMAAMFTIAWMRSTNEATALLAAGISMRRITAPLLIASAALSLVAVGNREWLIPSFRDRLAVKAQDYLMPKRLRPRYDHRTDVLIGGKQTLASEQKILEANFTIPPAFGDFGRRISAPVAIYQEPRADRPGGFLLQGVEQPANLADLASAYAGDVPVILSPSDTPWLGPSECFVATEVSFNQLAADPAWRRFASTAQLVDELHNPSLDYGAAEMVRVHARVIRPLLDLALLFLGLPLVVGREQKRLFVVAGGCLLIVAAFYLITLSSHALGSGYILSPTLAAWLPVLVFAPLACAISRPLLE